MLLVSAHAQSAGQVQKHSLYIAASIMCVKGYGKYKEGDQVSEPVGIETPFSSGHPARRLASRTNKKTAMFWSLIVTSHVTLHGVR
jgi:hypothetical protein